MSLLATGGAWLWGAFGGKVVELGGKLLNDATRRAYEKFDWSRAAERYRQQMHMLYGTMQIIGMGKPVPLADIFTDVFLLDKPRAWQGYNIEELENQLESKQINSFDQQRINALVLVQQHERLMILGKPGAGKTTLLKHLVLTCTTGQLDAVPIFVGLKSWADSGLNLIPFLAQQFAICDFPDAHPFIEHILADGRALVLFDGLDEVNLEQGVRDRITQEVRDLAAHYPRSRCIVTCRTAAVDYQFEGFSYCEVADFTDDQMELFVANWFQRNAGKREAFLAEIAAPYHDGLRDLARTPLLLALLCLAFDDTMRFPRRRADLYEEALDILLKKWDASRSINRHSLYGGLSLRHKRQMLARIAAETFRDNKLFMPREYLTRVISDFVLRLSSTNMVNSWEGETILREIEAQHGLLVERAHWIYSFSHLTFHEYFTARYVIEHPSGRIFDSVVFHAHDARWREVLLLIASMLDEVNAELFFNRFSASLEKRIQEQSDLKTMFQWIERKSEHILPNHEITQRISYIAPNYQIWTRISYLLLALISLAVSRFLEYSFDDPIRADASESIRSEVETLARDSARYLASELTRRFVVPNNHESGRDLDTILVNAGDRAQMIYKAHELLGIFHVITNGDLIGERVWQTVIVQTDWAWTFFLLWIEIVANDRSENLISQDYDDLLVVWRHLTATTRAESAVTQMHLTFPAQNAPADDWRQFASTLQVGLKTYQDIGDIWLLEKSDLDWVRDYLTAGYRMLQCLNLAAVADRDAIRNRLLLPPQP